jgi:photosystem II Psb27 protein
MRNPAFSAPALVPLVRAAPALAPCRSRAPTASAAPVSRRAALALGAALLSAAPLAARAASLQSTKGVKSEMTGDYKTDAARMLDDMREATALTRGAEGMADVVSRTRADMNDFVALYRRNTKVSGSTSYSVLYTACNTLSGHYASYGPLYPVPEKRKKRLVQQFTEVERALARGR